MQDRWCPQIQVGTNTFNEPNAFVMEIFCSGCPHKCIGCSNKSLQDFNSPETEWIEDTDFAEKIIQAYNSLIKELHILGGCPLYSYKRVQFLENVLKIVKNKIPNLQVFLFTGYSLHRLPKYAYSVLKYCNYIKCGEFKVNSKIKQRDNFKLYSDNQFVYAIEETGNSYQFIKVF